MTARDLCPECSGCGLRITRDAPDDTDTRDGWAVRDCQTCDGTGLVLEREAS